MISSYSCNIIKTTLISRPNVIKTTTQTNLTNTTCINNIHRGNNSLLYLKLSETVNRKDGKFPNPLISSNMITSSAEVNFHKNSNYQTLKYNPKQKISFTNYTRIIWISSQNVLKNTGKPDLGQLTLMLQDNSKPLHQKP